MAAVTRSTFKKNMASYFENVIKANKPLLVRDGLDGTADVVVMTQGKYKELLRRVNNAEYLAKIDRGLAQFSMGQWQEHELIELPDGEGILILGCHGHYDD